MASPAPGIGSWWDQRYREGSDRWELGALPPPLLPAYRQTMARLLRPQGWLLGLFWCHGRPGGSPYGSDAEALQSDFQAAGFAQEVWSPATHSAPGPDGEPATTNGWACGAGLHTEAVRADLP